MAVSSGMIWEIRTTGSNIGDSNGGGFNPDRGGTDRSTVGIPHREYTDLVIGSTNSTTLTSAAFPIASIDVGNVIRVEPGAGWTDGWYEIVSVSGSIAIMDRSVGTLGSTSGVGRMGGAWSKLHPETLRRGTPGNIFYIQQDGGSSAITYDITGSLIPPSGSSQRETQLIGYNTIRTDNGRVLLATSIPNLAAVFTVSGDFIAIRNFTIDGSGRAQIGASLTGAYGFLDNIHVKRCTQRGISAVYDFGGNGGGYLRRAYVEACSGAASGAAIFVHALDGIAGCVLHQVIASGNVTNGIKIHNNTPAHLIYCHSLRNELNGSMEGGNGLVISLESADGVWQTGPSIYNSNFWGNQANGILLEGDAAGSLGIIERCICACNLQYGIRSSGFVYTDQNHVDTILRHNAYFSNSLGHRLGTVSGSTEIDLTTSPFANPVNTINFELNNQPDGGLRLINAGASGSLTPLLPNTIRYQDIGAIETYSVVEDVGEG